MISEYPIQVRSGTGLVEQVAKAHSETTDLIERRGIQSIARVSPVYKNQLGMFGYVEFSLLNWTEGDEVPRLMRDEVPPEAISEDGTLRQGFSLNIDQLLGIIEVPGSIIEGLSKGSRRKGKRDKSFIHSFKIDYDHPESLSRAQLQGIPFEDGEKYFICYHPAAHYTNTADLEVFTNDINRAARIVVGYLFRMQEWVQHAKSQDWQKKALEYSELAAKPIRGEEEKLVLRVEND